jgi:hypothetical protein
LCFPYRPRGDLSKIYLELYPANVMVESDEVLAEAKTCADGARCQ